MHILTIETSCDETAVAIGEIKGGKVKIISHVVASQIKLHAKWGGVVPDLAAREHLKNLVPTIDVAFKQAGFSGQQEAFKKIKIIGVTAGPGLAPALLLGVNFAKALSYAWQKPLIPINHLEGHLYAPWVDESLKLNFSSQVFPALALIVSGGHTMLIEMADHLKYKIIGSTLDDAVGEAFDKVARIIGLGYPGGPQVSRLAKESQSDLTFSVPLKNSPSLDFSFSGLKTAVLYKALTMTKGKSLKEVLGRSPKPDLKISLSKKQKADLARAFERTAIEALEIKTIKALKNKKFKSFILGGGVASNEALRKSLLKLFGEKFPQIKILFSSPEHTGDNAAMLVPSTYLRWRRAEKEKKTDKYLKNWESLEVDPNWEL